MGKYICSTKEGSKYWFNWNCCGIFILILIHFIFIFSNAVSIFITIPTIVTTLWKKTLLIIVIEYLCILSEWSHIKCVFTDPGSVPKDAIPISTATEEEKLNMCVKCNQFKPPRAHHCSECGRCIVKMDHHCPWINNCVGIANTKFFLLFLLYTFAYCLLSIIICAAFFIHRLTLESQEPYKIALVTITCLFGLFFASFTISMFVESFSSLKSGLTAIDVLKGEKHKGSLQDSLKEAFGGKGTFTLWWLLPTTPVLLDRNDVLGYYRNCDAEIVVSSNDWVEGSM